MIIDPKDNKIPNEIPNEIPKYPNDFNYKFDDAYIKDEYDHSTGGLYILFAFIACIFLILFSYTSYTIIRKLAAGNAGKLAAENVTNDIDIDLDVNIYNISLTTIIIFIIISFSCFIAFSCIANLYLDKNSSLRSQDDKTILQDKISEKNKCCKTIYESEDMKILGVKRDSIIKACLEGKNSKCN